tara:strand:+ start:112 stop:372 length:261 start_codon:yes stop_codon:yes gene_type:complete
MVVRANLLASSLASLVSLGHLAPLQADELALASELVLLALASELVLLALTSDSLLALASELVLLALASEVLSEALYIQQQSVSLLS